MDQRALLLMLSCLGFGALFSALHACLVELSRAALEQMAGERTSIAGTRAGAARRILADVEGHAHAVALTRIVWNLAVAVTSVFLVASLRGSSSPDLTDALIGVAASAVLLWVFTVTIPESIAAHAAERFVFMFGPLVRATYLLQRPLAPIARLVDAIVAKLSGSGSTTKEEAVAEEILDVVEEGERTGAIDEDERRMIEAVVNFKNITVEQIMTPRNEIEALEYTNNLGAITGFVRKVRHSRIPVHRAGQGLDEVIGFFYVKDLLRWLAGDGPRGGIKGGPSPTGFELKTILRPALHVPDSKTVRELADEFVAKKVHAAMVVDEYGAVTGLVSMEDIIEEVFGDIQDEYENKPDDAPPKIEIKPEDKLADIDARAYVGDANQALEPLGIKLPEADDYDTVGGFVITTLGHMPQVNESFSYGLMHLTILEASPTRVLKVRVQVKDPEPPPVADVVVERKSEAALERGK
jgi:CBS domain containing-hemolysin-like protein